MILAALLLVQPALPPRIDLDRVLRAPPLILNARAATCAVWNERRREDRTARIADLAWLGGFLDGARARSAGPIEGDAALLLGSMDDGCERRPEALVIDTARAALARLGAQRP